MNQIELSIVMPCLNEADTIGACVLKSFKLLQRYNISGEVIVVDNGSTDNSQEIAEEHGATIAREKKKGYGNALIAGIRAAKGKYVLMGDSDDTYDFSEAYPIILKLREGYQLVMGNRFLGKIEKDAMPFSHQYIGNPFLSFLGKVLFRVKIGDFHCGIRGFVRDDINKLSLQSPGMEFASELVVAASIMNYQITEVPVNLYSSAENRRSKLRTIRDGFRHLIYLLKTRIMGKDQQTFYELIRYVITGASSQALGFLFLFLATSVLNIWYLVSNVFADTLSLCFSYLVNNYWTFKNKKSSIKKIWLTLLLHLFNIMVSVLLMYILTSLIGFHYLISKIIVTGISCIWNFLIAKNIIYRREKQ
jgi:glycosyltransferase involved in cell wall biosynthesis